MQICIILYEFSKTTIYEMKLTNEILTNTICKPKDELTTALLLATEKRNYGLT